METEPPPHRRADVARLHAHMLAQARGLLAEAGIGGFSYSALAQRARVSRMTILAHWASRPALFGELFTESVLDVLSGLPEPSPGASARVRVCEFLTAVQAGLQVPQVAAPMAVMFGLAETDAAARQAVRGLSEDLHLLANRALVGTGVSLRRAEFDRLLGPVFAARFLATTPAHDSPGSTLVEHAVDRWWTARAAGNRQALPRGGSRGSGDVILVKPAHPTLVR